MLFGKPDAYPNRRLGIVFAPNVKRPRQRAPKLHWTISGAARAYSLVEELPCLFRQFVRPCRENALFGIARLPAQQFFRLIG